MKAGYYYHKTMLTKPKDWCQFGAQEDDLTALMTVKEFNDELPRDQQITVLARFDGVGMVILFGDEGKKEKAK